MSDASNMSHKELPPGEEVKEHLKSRSTWMRVIYMVVFAFVLYVSKFVLLAIAVLQIIAALFTGEPNRRLVRFGGSLSQFIYQIARFLTFNSDDMPFPFADWPDDSDAAPLIRSKTPRRSKSKSKAKSPPKTVEQDPKAEDPEKD